jgi:hypothetical protein
MIIVPLDEDAGSVAKKQEFAGQKLELAEAHKLPFVAVVNYDSAWRDPLARYCRRLSAPR